MKWTVSQAVPRKSTIKKVTVELLSLRISSRCLHDCLWMEKCLILILVSMFWNTNFSPVKILCMINPHWMIAYLTTVDIQWCYHLALCKHLSFPQVGRITGSGRSGRKSYFKLAMPLHSLSFTSKVRALYIAKPSLQGSCSIKKV